MPTFCANCVTSPWWSMFSIIMILYHTILYIMNHETMLYIYIHISFQLTHDLSSCIILTNPWRLSRFAMKFHPGSRPRAFHRVRPCGSAQESQSLRRGQHFRPWTGSCDPRRFLGRPANPLDKNLMEWIPKEPLEGWVNSNNLGGGFTHFLFSHLFGEMIHFD